MKHSRPLVAVILAAVTCFLPQPSHAKKIKVKKAEVIKEEKRPPKPYVSKTQKEMIKRLKDIVIPDVKFEDAAPVTVIEYLKLSSKKNDPEKRGVNFFQLNLKKASTRITLAAHDMSLYDLIKYVCMVGNLSYKIEAHAVIIKPQPEK